MKVPFIQRSLDVLDHVAEEEIFIPESPLASEIGSNSQGPHDDDDGEIIPETSSESDGDTTEDLFSEDGETPPDNNDFIPEVSSDNERRTYLEDFENIIVPESDVSENSSEYENDDALAPPLNDSIHETPENEYSADSVYLSGTSSENESASGVDIFGKTIVMETDSSESDADSFELHGIPLQIEPVYIPETDLSGNDEAEGSEIDFPVEHETTIPETSSESEEENYAPASGEHLTTLSSIHDHLLTPVHDPLNENSERSPDLFSEVSTHSNHEVALDTESQNSFIVAEEPMTGSISPSLSSLFSDDNVSETFSIVAETESGSISPDIFDDEVLEMSHNEHQGADELLIVHEDSEEIPATPFANEPSFPLFVPYIASEPIILSPNPIESAPIVPPVIEYQDRLESDDDDETIMPEIINPIEISAESRAIIDRIERFIASIVVDLRSGNKIQVVVQNRQNWDNCSIENERYVLRPISDARCRHIKSTFSLSVIFFVLSEIHELLSTNRRCTIRELYYKDVNITQKQENVSEALKTICCLLDVAPWELGVLSTSKGLIAGPLEIQLPDNSIVDCSIDRHGITLPHLTAGIIDLRTTATHILLVEKDTVFKNLLQNNLMERWNHSCILITGKGYPDTNTRLILSKLQELHSLPIDIVTDADPYGVEIMLTYRHGSLSMSNLAESLAVPSVRWLGIFPSDIRKFGIRSVPLTDEDKRKLDNILNRPFINDHVHRELLIMKQINLKAEIEGISESSCTYLIDVYLRNKIDSNTSI